MVISIRVRILTVALKMPNMSEIHKVYNNLLRFGTAFNKNTREEASTSPVRLELKSTFELTHKIW